MSDAAHGTITGYHAHVYFDAQSVAQARSLCERAAARFDLAMGHMHQRPVGPHPCWSCQLAFAPDLFGEVIPWLAMHREGLTIFVHPESGDDLRDHRDHAMWMGSIEPLKLSMFEE